MSLPSATSSQGKATVALYKSVTLLSEAVPVPQIEYDCEGLIHMQRMAFVFGNL